MGLFDDLLNKFTRKKAAASTVPTSAPVLSPSSDSSITWRPPNPPGAVPPSLSANTPPSAPPVAPPFRVTEPQPPAAGGGFMRGDPAAAARGYAQAQAIPPVQPPGPAPAVSNVPGLPEGDMASRITARTAAPTAEELAARNAKAKTYMGSKATPKPVSSPAATAAPRKVASSQPAGGMSKVGGFMLGAGSMIPGALSARDEILSTGGLSPERGGLLAVESGLALMNPAVAAVVNPAAEGAIAWGNSKVADAKRDAASWTKDPSNPISQGLREKFPAMYGDRPATPAIEQAGGALDVGPGGNTMADILAGREASKPTAEQQSNAAVAEVARKAPPVSVMRSSVAQSPAKVADASPTERAEDLAADRAQAEAFDREAQPERGSFMRTAPESQEDRAIRLTEEGRQKRLVTQATANAKGTEKRREGESFMRDRAARQDAGVARADANRNLEQDRNLALNLGALNAAGMVQGAQAKAGAELTKTLADANARIQEAQVNAQGEAAKARVSAAGEAFKAKLTNGIPVTDSSGQPVFDKLKDGKRVPRMRPMTGEEQAAAYRDFEAQAGLAVSVEENGGGGGSGGPRVGATATNRQTGQRVRWDGSQWVPVSAATAGV